MCRTAPRRRLQRFDVLLVRGATQREWVDQTTKPGQQGGCAGTVIDLEVEQSKLTTKESMETDEQYRQQITPDDLDAAEALLLRLQRDAVSLRSGKSIIDHSIPNELLRIIYKP